MNKKQIGALGRLLPQKMLSTSPEVLAVHSCDAWFASHLPDVVAFPSSAKHVSTILKFAQRYHIPVTARGAGRGYVGGCVPERGGIVLSLKRMNKIRKISLQDSLAIVQPGVITKDIQDAAKEKGLFYPPDPASLHESTIGGNIATNAGGPHCVKYGVTGNYVLGLEVVLANGTVLKTGGQTIKNRTGFNLTGLFVGSEGMLGIVTEATLRLIPYPPERTGIIAPFSNPRHAAEAIMFLQQSGVIPAALEIVDSFTLNAARKYSPSIPQGNAMILIELDGQKNSLRLEAQAIAKLLRKSGALDVIIKEGNRNCEEIWNIRRTFSESLKATGLKKLNEDVTVPRGRLLDLFRFAEKLQKKTGFPIACFGHAGDGNIHVNVMVPTDAAPRTYQSVLDQLFVQIIEWEGAISGEHGIGLAKKRWWKSATSRELRALHQAIKGALDPEGILNPGKFLDR